MTTTIVVIAGVAIFCLLWDWISRRVWFPPWGPPPRRPPRPPG